MGVVASLTNGDAEEATVAHNLFDRAYELALECRGLSSLSAKLKAEGFPGVDAHLDASPSFKRELRTIMREAKRRGQPAD